MTRLTGLDDQVIVVAHQNVSVDAEAKALTAPAQTGEKSLSIVVVAKDRVSLVASVENVIEGVGLFYA